MKRKKKEHRSGKVFEIYIYIYLQRKKKKKSNCRAFNGLNVFKVNISEQILSVDKIAVACAILDGSIFFLFDLFLFYCFKRIF